jgi:hypothetical protein
VRWQTARPGTRKPDPASQRQAVKSNHLIRRSMRFVRLVRQDPKPQVRFHRVSDAGIRGPVPSDQSVRKR